jgi:hypothetical protein
MSPLSTAGCALTVSVGNENEFRGTVLGPNWTQIDAGFIGPARQNPVSHAGRHSRWSLNNTQDCALDD